MKRILLFLLATALLVLSACTTDSRLAYYEPPVVEEEPVPTEEEPVPTEEERLLSLGYQILKDDYALALIPFALIHEPAEDIPEQYVLFHDGGDYNKGIWYKIVGIHLHIYTWNEDGITIDFYYPITDNLLLITSNAVIAELVGVPDESN